MRVKQLYEPASSTCSYLLWDEDSKEAALIDPVQNMAGRDVAEIRERGLTLKYTLETHVHEDHITGSGYLRQALNSIVIVHENSRSKCADVLLKDGDFVPLGHQRINILYTPGHTDNHICFTIPGAVFTGDSLLIGGCGRTDYGTGDVGEMYDSITGKLFALPDETLIYPGHGPQDGACSTIGEEKLANPHINGHISRDEFIACMKSIKQDPPQILHDALPSNLRCGVSGYRGL